MILIADSGSTKCDWVLLDQNGEQVFKTRTEGLNPNILTTQRLHKRIAKSAELAHVNEEVEQVHFFGAGCGTLKNQNRLKRFFEKYFRRASCEVQEDIMAACLAVTQSPGIVCILGTGSNACYFDGKNTKVPAPSLGYMVMDEASGNYFGKQLLRDYFYHQMPSKIGVQFKKNYKLSPQYIKDQLYKKPNPNAYLADFAKFIFDFDPLPPYLENLLAKGIEDFLEHWVNAFEEAKNVPIHFVGSIATHAKPVIAQILDKNEMTLGRIEQHPIDGLAHYFKKRIAENPTQKDPRRRPRRR